MEPRSPEKETAKDAEGAQLRSPSLSRNCYNDKESGEMGCPKKKIEEAGIEPNAALGCIISPANRHDESNGSLTDGIPTTTSMGTNLGWRSRASPPAPTVTPQRGLHPEIGGNPDDDTQHSDACTTRARCSTQIREWKFTIAWRTTNPSAEVKSSASTVFVQTASCSSMARAFVVMTGMATELNEPAEISDRLSFDRGVPDEELESELAESSISLSSYPDFEADF
ncbi:hypothetical protein Acr_29g0010580 [Actinidia rufa]|uniref:Uncharacterized protein n=1 Tax=Actinidia rufa TaxID=165716 RepID=A0A7J0HFI9_9ERIC|nr:hypothetical protein Acr_29g0010580 [Actinidia rufa]